VDSFGSVLIAIAGGIAGQKDTLYMAWPRNTSIGFQAMMEIENGKIERTFLGVEGHGIFTGWIHMAGEGWGQGFGGRVLDGDYTATWIRGVLEAVGVDEWEQLIGKPVRVERTGGTLTGLGHYYKDQWYRP